MEVVYLLVLLAVVLAGVVGWAFFWSVKSGQFDDLEGPAHRILMDRDQPEEADTGERRTEKANRPKTGGTDRPASSSRTRCDQSKRAP